MSDPSNLNVTLDEKGPAVHNYGQAELPVTKENKVNTTSYEEVFNDRKMVFVTKIRKFLIGGHDKNFNFKSLMYKDTEEEIFDVDSPEYTMLDPIEKTILFNIIKLIFLEIRSNDKKDKKNALSSRYQLEYLKMKFKCENVITMGIKMGKIMHELESSKKSLGDISEINPNFQPMNMKT